MIQPLPTLDRFLSAAILADPTERERGRVIVAVSLMGFVAASGVGAILIVQEIPASLLVAVIAMLTQGAILAWLGRARTTGPIGDVVVLQMLLPLLVVAAADGGLHSGAAPWFPVAPLVAGVVGGRLGLIPVAGILIVGAACIHAAMIAGLLPSAPSLESTAGLRLSALVIAIVYAATFVWVLDRSRRRAQAARESFLAAREDWVSVVSHELRTPATTIHGALSLLRNADPSLAHEDRAQLLHMAHKGSARLARLVNDLLQIERLDRGITTLELVETPLAPRVQSCADDLAVVGSDRGVVLRTELSPVTCRVDGDRIHQVVTNLINNALKFSPRGGIVTVRLGPTPGGGARLEFEDAGPGVPPDLGEAIFDRFRQADSTSSRSAEGLGLGLFISRRFVELHGGRIGHHPAPTAGTVFWVELPA